MLKRCDACHRVFCTGTRAKRCSPECRVEAIRAYKKEHNAKPEIAEARRRRGRTPEARAREAARGRTEAAKEWRRVYKASPRYRAYENAYKRRLCAERRLVRILALSDVIRDSLNKKSAPRKEPLGHIVETPENIGTLPSDPGKDA